MIELFTTGMLFWCVWFVASGGDDNGSKNKDSGSKKKD